MNPPHHSPPHSADLAGISSEVRAADRLRREFGQGAARNPEGIEISADRHSLLLDGRHWMPVMGEMQYSRCARSTWRDSLLKMRAGGIDIVATYVFWIHHEEIEGQFDFTDRRNLREFVALCRELGLYVQMRCGPWCHGECRNGGFPDWLLRKGHFAIVPAEAAVCDSEIQTGYALRTDDPGYLAEVRRLYEQIAGQLHGLLWKDGGPVIGMQIENEYSGPSEHILSLKRMAREVGLDVPIYTFTGWPLPRTKMPFGQMLPLFGGYAEGMWDRNIEQMPGGYWEAFSFKSHRIDSTIATDHFGKREEKDENDAIHYPYITCELGGGMVNSYHRRVQIFARDVAAPALIKLGVGNSLPGYYMYHGGTNPDGKLTTFHESQATNYPNDITVKSYDFQAPLGEFGQVREHYHWLRRMHLFIHDYGELMAPMSSMLPAARPTGRDDTQTLRWCVRSNGSSGFVFVNNYQRLQPMPPKPGVQFQLHLRNGEVTLPARPATVASDSFFIWPFHIDIGGVNLVYATAEIICNLDEGGAHYVFFAETPGVPAEFAFDMTAKSVNSSGTASERDGVLHVEGVRAGLQVAIRLRTPAGRDVCIVLLDQETSLSCWKVALGGRKHIAITAATLLPEEDFLRCHVSSEVKSTLALFPSPAKAEIDGKPLEGRDDGIFTRYTLPGPVAEHVNVTLEPLREADTARAVPIGPFGVALAPTDEDFEHAAVWRVQIDGHSNSLQNVILRFHYMGDVARAYLNGRLLTDDFYNGKPFDLGLDPYAPEIHAGELLLKILPLRSDAPIYLLPEAWPGQPTTEGTAEVKGVEVIHARELEFRAS
ncbi:MAG: beta-galactosidase [Terrimicrobiaceae bacterium]|nr:beta-galactosidase [Terrimicrobiaceae bacterium]